MKLRNRTIIRFLARLIALSCRMLYATCRIRVIEGAPLTSPYASSGAHRYLYCTWHDGILNSLFCGTCINCSALTSRHSDGEYVAEVMEAIGIEPIRGSHGNGGAAAVKQMLDSIENYHVVVTTDGPRGPRRTVKPGIIFLAAQTGRAIVPVACSARNAWRPKGKWTDLLIPRPFTKTYVLGGELMFVPPDITRQQLAPFCKELQRRMDELQAKVELIASGQLPETAHGDDRAARAA